MDRLLKSMNMVSIEILRTDIEKINKVNPHTPKLLVIFPIAHASRENWQCHRGLATSIKPIVNSYSTNLSRIIMS